MTRASKRHHTVSRFYLSYFANDADQVTTVETPDGKSYTQSVANASVQSHFYTAVDISGEPTDKAEQSFGILEGLAAKAWRGIASGIWPLPQDLRAAMAGWLALHLLRGPNVRTALAEMNTSYLTLSAVLGGRALVREALEEHGQPADEEAVNRAWVGFFADPSAASVSANEHLRFVGRALPEVMNLLLDRVWFLSVYEQKRLATCDHPVFVAPNSAPHEVGRVVDPDRVRPVRRPIRERPPFTADRTR